MLCLLYLILYFHSHLTHRVLHLYLFLNTLQNMTDVLSLIADFPRVDSPPKNDDTYYVWKHAYRLSTL